MDHISEGRIKERVLSEGGQDDSVSPSLLADKIGEVVKDNQYVIFAEHHTDSHQNMELITSSEVMQAMEDGGVKHIKIEGMSEADAAVLNAYADGEITKGQLESYIEENIKGGLSGAGGVEFSTEQELEQEYIKLANQLKEHDMHVGGLNNGEGLFSEQSQELDRQRDIDTGKRVVEEIKASGQDNVSHIDRDKIQQEITEEKYKGLDERIDQDIALSNEEYRQQAEKLIEDNPQIQKTIEENGISHDEAVSRISVSLWERERVSQDDHVAKNVMDSTNGEKTAVIYGAGHTAHRKGDLDSHLEKEAETAVIAIYHDKDMVINGQEKYPPPEKVFTPLEDKKPIIDVILGRSSFENPDYEIDAGKGTWTERGKEPEKIILPKEEKIPEPVVQSDHEAGDKGYHQGPNGGPLTMIVDNQPVSGEPLIDWKNDQVFALSGFFNQTIDPLESNVRSVDGVIDFAAAPAMNDDHYDIIKAPQTQFNV